MTAGQIAFVSVAGLVYVFWAVLLLRPLPPFEGRGELIVLRHFRALRVFSLGLALIVPGGLVVLGFLTNAKNEEAIALTVLIVFGATLITLLLLETFRLRLAISDEGVELQSPWTGYRFLLWDEITEVQYSEQCLWFVLVDQDGRKLRASTYLNGIIALVRAFRMHLPKVRYENAYRGIERVDHTEPEKFRRQL